MIGGRGALIFSIRKRVVYAVSFQHQERRSIIFTTSTETSLYEHYRDRTFILKDHERLVHLNTHSRKKLKTLKIFGGVQATFVESSVMTDAYHNPLMVSSIEVIEYNILCGGSNKIWSNTSRDPSSKHIVGRFYKRQVKELWLCRENGVLDVITPNQARKTVTLLRGHLSISHYDFMPDEDFLVVVDKEKNVRTVNLRTGEIDEGFRVEDVEAVNSLVCFGEKCFGVLFNVIRQGLTGISKTISPIR